MRAVSSLWRMSRTPKIERCTKKFELGYSICCAEIVLYALPSLSATSVMLKRASVIACLRLSFMVFLFFWEFWEGRGCEVHVECFSEEVRYDVGTVYYWNDAPEVEIVWQND